MRSSLADAVRKAFTNLVRPAADFEAGELGASVATEAVDTPGRDALAADGLFVSPTPITAGESVRFWYAGALATSSARQIFMHTGVGPGAWQQVRDLPMEESSDGVWTCEMQVANGGRLEMCFHDGTGNWDNNQGKNWSYTIHTGLF